MIRVWKKFSTWVEWLSPWEKTVLILLLLILGSIWLIFDVTPIHK